MKATRVCSIESCGKTTDSRGLCGSHYARLRRYGDPLWQRTSKKRDLLGQRFGMLLVVADGGPHHWVCRCDCGAESTVRTWCLNSGGTTKCGDNQHRQSESVAYLGAHKRVVKEKGPASDHPCIDCAGRAREWSYNHGDPNPLYEETKGARLYYSLSSENYEPRCTPCHRKFDRAAYSEPESP